MRVDMTRWRSTLVTAALALGLGLPAVASAQMQFSFGGGWMGLSTPEAQPYSRPFHFMASIAPTNSGPVHVRTDLVALEYQMANDRLIFDAPAPPCAWPGCSASNPLKPFQGLTVGFLANAQIDLLPEGRAYLLTGAGVYRLQLQGQPVSVHPGGTFGMGFNIPLSHSADMYVEARWMGVNGEFTGPSWYLPLTVGFRTH